MPISRHVLITRSAISPRLAISIFLNTVYWFVNQNDWILIGVGGSHRLAGIYQEQWLVIFHGGSVFHQDLHNTALHFTFNFIE